MSTNSTTVSVVIPIYNSRPYLEGCLASVLVQTEPPAQIILVDDRGQDDSMAFAQRYLADRGIEHEVVTQDRNRGLGCARNSGLQRATGDLVWFLDSDDRAEPDFLETLTTSLVDHNADFACTRTRRVDADDNDLGIDEPAYGRAVMSGDDFAHTLIRGDAKAYACTKLFRRTILGDGPWEEGQSYEDFAPLVRLGLLAERVALVDRPLYLYLFREGSLTTKFTARTLDLFKVGDDVLAAVAGRGLDATWRADLRGFRYREVLTSVAHVAMRARHAATTPPPLYDTALSRVRRAIAPSDVVPLVRTGHHREAIFAVMVKTVPWLYSAILRYR